MACGAQAHLSFSAVTGLARPGEVWLYGTQGTLRLDIGADALFGGSQGTPRLDMGAGALFGGRRGDSQLTKIDIPHQKPGKWRVEEEFINAIRGIEEVTYTTFEDGVRYMEFTEAVARSAQSGTVVPLPL